MAEPKPASWEAVLASQRPEVAGAGRAIEALIRETLPGVVVRFDQGDGLLALGTTEAMRDLLFALIPHASWLNLQLADGAVLDDPDGIVEGTGKRIRHVKLRSPDDATTPSVRAIVAAQIAFRPRAG
jgi:hypothetical protein